ncbi:fucose permease [Natranaerovirga hydrolytica]|uniref:Fucose permease n=1 Tax=Natranaerovirga hydrolytica TaxID=680378 RepID=A0A4V2Q1M4_9FIRM|nr:MFS transporter [Natranaerovirga hydrolytica]TCK98181.1 fucose permease [Natranaerovirga hydrolytica]
MNSKNKVITQTFYTFFVNGLLALMIGSIMPFIIQEYDISYVVAGMFISLHSFGNLFSSLLVGYSVYRFGRKISIVCLSSLSAIAFTGIILTTNIPLLYLLFFLTGIARGSVSNVNNGIINDIAVGKSGMLNLLHTFFAVGAFLTPIIASFITGMGYSWKWVVIIGIVFSITSVFIYALMRMELINQSEKTQDEDENEPINRVPYYKSVDFYLAAALAFFYLGAENSVNGWLVTYFSDTGIMSTAYAQRLLSVLWVIIIVGRLLTAYLSRYLKAKSLILINSIGATLFFIILVLNRNIIVVTVSLIFFGFFLAGVFPTTISSVGRIVKGSSGGIAVLLAFAGIGGTILPAITGAVAERVGMAGGMTLIAMDICLMLICAIVIKIRGDQVTT